MIRVHLELGQDFGRAMELYLIEETEASGTRETFLLMPNPDYSATKMYVNPFLRIPVIEGEALPRGKGCFLHIGMAQGMEILRGLTTELARHGYITPDPYGTKVKAVEDHNDTLRRENDRYFSLLEKTTLALIEQAKLPTILPVMEELSRRRK